MIINFKTARNTNGHSRFLSINTEEKTFTRVYNRISDLTEAATLKTKDYKDMVEKLRKEGWTEY